MMKHRWNIEYLLKLTCTSLADFSYDWNLIPLDNMGNRAFKIPFTHSTTDLDPQSVSLKIILYGSGIASFCMNGVTRKLEPHAP